jgi:hypothetical protein
VGRTARGVGVMGMSKSEAREVARKWAERTCQAQGVPVKLEDRAAIGKVVVLLGQSRQTGSIRSASKRVRPRTAGRTIARSRTAATMAR